MRNDSFTQEALYAAYSLAAEGSHADFGEFAEHSKFLDFAVYSLGSGMSMDVQCDTGLPVSTPAEKRDKLFQKRLERSQKKANQILNRQRKVQEKLAKAQERQLRKDQRAQS
jgi:hypothetical protein